MQIPTQLNDSLNVWGRGQLLAFSAVDGRTDYQDGLVARTGGPSASVQIMMPGRADLVFSETPPTRCFVTSDVLILDTPKGSVTAAFVDAHHLLFEGPCQVRSCDPLLTVTQVRNRTLVAARRYEYPACINADIEDTVSRRLAWLASRRIPSSLSGSTRRTLLKALSVMKSQVYSPEGGILHRWSTPDRWPHRNMWLWDSAFHAIGWRNTDPQMARDLIDAVLDRQCPDGRIAIMTAPYADDTTGRTQPPVLTLAAWLIDQTSPDSEWLDRIYPALCRYIEWDLANRDSDASGLLEWLVENRPNCPCAESGADNSSRFLSAQPLHVPEFNALVALECELLARMATRLRRPKEEQELWLDRHSRICRRMNERLWSKPFGMYMDVPVGQRESTDVMSFAGFMPLVCLAPDRRQTESLLKHLRNPATFGTPLPVPSIAPSSSPHYRKDMWCGPVWMNINWLIALGLRRSGHESEAAAMRASSMAEIERQYERYGAIFEFFDDEKTIDPPALLRKGSCNPDEWIHQVIHDYGWTAACYADWVFGTAGL